VARIGLGEGGRAWEQSLAGSSSNSSSISTPWLTPARKPRVAVGRRDGRFSHSVVAVGALGRAREDTARWCFGRGVHVVWPVGGNRTAVVVSGASLPMLSKVLSNGPE
jgi:hypothetical protein